MESFARTPRRAPPRCVISLRALGISRGSVWFGSGFHSVSINIQLLFVKGMYNPLKYIFGTRRSHLVLVQEYSWCHLGQDNGNLSQSCVFILLVPSLPHTNGGGYEYAAFQELGACPEPQTPTARGGDLSFSNRHPKSGYQWLNSTKTPAGLQARGRFPALSGLIPENEAFPC